MYFRYIGRIAFPVYAYMIAQGCKHTKSINKYLLRLGIFALVSEIPFDIAFGYEISFIRNTNVFYTLFIGAACIAVYEKIKSRFSDYDTKPDTKSDIKPDTKSDTKPDTKSDTKSDIKPNTKPDNSSKIEPVQIILSILLLTPIALLANLLGTDYGTRGVICILIFYFLKPELKVTRTIAAIGVAVYLYGVPLYNEISQYMELGPNFVDSLIYVVTRAGNHRLYIFLFSLIPALMVLLYNGKPGPKMKWVFYAFYPVHLVILAVIKYLL